MPDYLVDTPRGKVRVSAPVASETPSIFGFIKQIFDLDPNAERLGILPHPQGALKSEGRGSKPIDWGNWVAPQIVKDAVDAIKAPGQALQGQEMTVGDAVNFGMNVMGAGVGLSSIKGGQLSPATLAANMARKAQIKEPPVPPSGFIKAYRGIEAGRPFNDSGSAWLTTNPDVAKAYAREVWGYENPQVIEVWVNPKGLNIYDMRKLTPEQQIALGGDADAMAPQAIGIYRNADDTSLGRSVNHTTIHTPIENIWMPPAGGEITK